MHYCYNSLALEPTPPYTPHISYFYWDNLDLKHAWLSGTTWLSETVDSAGDVGWYTSLALDSSVNPHISYLDNTGDLKYAYIPSVCNIYLPIITKTYPQP